MKIEKTLLILFLMLSSVAGESNMGLFEEYHDELCTILVNTSNSIDDYFIDGNGSTPSSTTYAELSSSIAMEANQKLEKDVRLRLRLSLPKIQKNLRLIFEDENNDNSLYDRTTLNDEKLIDKSYYLRVEYFKVIKEQFNLALGAGLRVRQGHLVPYLNLRSRYDVYKDSKIKSSFYNRLRLYSDGEREDILEFNNIYTFDDSVYAIFRNQLSHSNNNAFETVYHDLSLVKELNSKKQLSVGMGIRSNLENFKNYTIEYYHIHTLYHHLFYKKWLYYQVAPSVLWREANGFNISYRIMLNFGIYFRK